MIPPLPWTAFAALLLLGVSASYWLLANRWLRQWITERQEFPPTRGSLPSVTFLRPLKRDTPKLKATLETLVKAMRPDDQLLLGVESDSEAEVICEDLRRRFLERDIQLVRCTHSAGLNPKICKLLQMAPHARHEHWILSDSEALLDAAFLEGFRSEWATRGADALTAGYRVSDLDTLPQRLDAASSLLTLWPGLAVLRRFGKVDVTLGACTAFHRTDLETIGGFAALNRDLAEDNRLGRALTRAARKVQLSAHVVTLVSDAMDWREYWRHQRRVAVTYRVSSPAGFAASIFTHGLSLIVAAAFFVGTTRPFLALSLVGSAWFVRWFTARRTAELLTFPFPNLAVVIFAASLVETVCWALAWVTRRVWWAGKWWRVSPEGKLRLF
jgi:ceramide glucosyltransferase